MMNGVNKLGLGTVQFGMDYGVSNKLGQVSIDEIGLMLEFATANGIDTIDTAHLYGASEEVLGKFDLSEFNIVTKTAKIDKTISRFDNFELFKEAFFASQKKLGYVELHGLMFHESNDLLSEQGLALWDLLEDFKQKDYVRNIGVSVYSPEQLQSVLEVVDIDIVQLPLNLLDQRFLPMLSELKRKNIEIHTRSTFLQGLLLMNTGEVSPYFSHIMRILKQVPEPKLASVLGFVKNIAEVDKIIVGCTSRKELQEIFTMYNEKVGSLDSSKFKVDEQRFINPSLWRL